MIGGNDLENRFSYHKPTPEMVPVFAAIREKLKEAAMLIDQSVPDGREKATAISKLEEAGFWANAALARSGEIDRG